MSVVIYTTSHCPECNVLKMFLRDYNIPFETRNCSIHPEYWEDVKKMGFLGVPVVLVHDKKINGFKPEEIMKEWEKK